MFDKVLENKKTEIIIISILLIIFFIVVATSLTGKSAIIDEVAHLPAGYTYFTRFDYRLNVEHPPLVKMLSAAPLLFVKPNTPLNETLFENSYEWEYGKQLLYFSGNDADLLLLLGKIPMILLGMLGGIFVYLWARELYGKKAAIFALFLFIFCPNILAHSGIIQTDMGTAAFMLMTLYFFWKFIKHVDEEQINNAGNERDAISTTTTIADENKGDNNEGDKVIVNENKSSKEDKENSRYKKTRYKFLILAGIALGLGLATKFTGLFFIPIMLLMLGLKTLSTISKEYPHLKNLKSKNFASNFNPSNNFKSYSNFKSSAKELIKKLSLYSAYFIIILGIAFIILLSVYGFKNFHYYIEGLGKVSIHSTIGHPSFLMGEHSNHGWWYYFIIAFLIKTQIPLLILLLLALIVTAKKLLSRKFIDEYFLLIPIGIYFSAFMFNHINIGVRHILPIYPFLFILVSSIITIKIKPDIADYVYKGVIIALIVWYFIGAILIYPHFLAYFNGFAGGPDNGHKYLIDSNIDWGQDLKGVAKWVYENNLNLNGSVLRIAYIGNEPLSYREVNFTEATCYPVNGITIASVNALQDIANKKDGCLEWLKEYTPIKKIGYSIFIYNISDQKIENYQKSCEMECPKVCKSRGKKVREAIADITREKCLCECVY